ncbi:MAG TPA: DUF4252 domain-containing protein [Bacteroidales bacterium]|nr:DUF4252 domain-containing protein [Bacteroidales bacterium]HPE54947.1 DUF4252 domain-containing protein [Bacteroidales bacterium]HRX98006.1 DUF4252 domain-containing protein [Bacteroidales bacterium]
MKTKIIAILIILAAIPAMLAAQSNPLDQMIKKYSDKQGFYFLDLKTNLMSKLVDSTGQSNNKVINLKMITFNEDQNNSFKASNLYKQFFNGFDKSNYKGVIEVKSSGNNVEMLIRKEGDKLAEVIIVVQEETEITLIAASGNFDMSDLSKFEHMKSCHGMQIINQLCEE